MAVVAAAAKHEGVLKYPKIFLFLILPLDEAVLGQIVLLFDRNVVLTSQ